MQVQKTNNFPEGIECKVEENSQETENKRDQEPKR